MNYRMLVFLLSWAVISSATSSSSPDAGSLHLHTSLRNATKPDKNETYEDYLKSLDDMPSLLRVAIYGLGVASLCKESPLLTEAQRHEWLPVARNTILRRLALYLAPGGHPDLSRGGPAEKLSRQMAGILVQIPLTITTPVAGDIESCLSALVFAALRDGMCFLPQWQSEGETNARHEPMRLQPEWHALQTTFWSTLARWRNSTCVVGLIVAILGYLLHNTTTGDRIKTRLQGHLKPRVQHHTENT